MQTFLPYQDFSKSAEVLDRMRLGKQRVECLQILNTLSGINGKLNRGWRNHPAVKQWIGSEYYLCQYGLCICSEWIKRGYNDTVKEKILYLMENVFNKESNKKFPSFLGNNDYHSSHRAALLYKMPDWYCNYGWSETPQLDYWWPSNNEQKI